jgi:hypothetical protein
MMQLKLNYLLNCLLMPPQAAFGELRLSKAPLMRQTCQNPFSTDSA